MYNIRIATELSTLVNGMGKTEWETSRCLHFVNLIMEEESRMIFPIVRRN